MSSLKPKVRFYRNHSTFDILLLLYMGFLFVFDPVCTPLTGVWLLYVIKYLLLKYRLTVSDESNTERRVKISVGVSKKAPNPGGTSK